MGYIVHRYTLVTSWDHAKLTLAHAAAQTIHPAEQVTPITPSPINGYFTFCIVPRGSKAGWDEAEDDERCRERFAAWLPQHDYGDGSTCLKVLDIAYGEEGEGAVMVRNPTVYDETRDHFDRPTAPYVWESPANVRTVTA